VNTKYEIMEALNENGVGFFPNDEGACTALYSKFKGNKRLFGLQIEGNDVWAEDIEAGAFGSTFTLCRREERCRCATKLLGKHNIMNILGCAAVASELGLSFVEIAEGIEKIEPIEHRLQLMNPGTGVLIVDDAFNSNPQGTQMAMDVLRMFTGYRKICVTPGMVELGESEYNENRQFGLRMALVCDIVILVGELRAKAMAQGLLQGGFPADKIHIVADLDRATAVLATLTRAGDVVLFENDLPDHYVS
jgi:UDP-N-acetylmuramoyl-tripeptide--D-alanyl-D-alanine ligase